MAAGGVGVTRVSTTDRCLYAYRVCMMLEVSSRKILRLLRAAGWFKVAQEGSHVQLKHPEKPGRVTVPHPRRDMPIGTLKSIERLAGMKLR